MAKIGEKTIKVLVVDDHLMLTQSLKQMIDNQDDMKVCGIAETANESLKIIEQEEPDIAIIDINLKGNVNGIDLVASLRKRYPEIKALVMSMYDEELYAERAIKAGARGYLMKNAVIDTLFIAIRQVVKGKIYLSDKITSNLLENFITKSDTVSTDIVGILSNREFEIFQLIAKGLSSIDIADKLQISKSTVDVNRKNIRSKLNLKNNSELIHYAYDWTREQ